jgi:hypothetical protein
LRHLELGAVGRKQRGSGGRGLLPWGGGQRTGGDQFVAHHAHRVFQLFAGARALDQLLGEALGRLVGGEARVELERDLTPRRALERGLIGAAEQLDHVVTARRLDHVRRLPGLQPLHRLQQLVGADAVVLREATHLAAGDRGVCAAELAGDRGEVLARGDSITSRLGLLLLRRGRVIGLDLWQRDHDLAHQRAVRGPVLLLCFPGGVDLVLVLEAKAIDDRVVQIQRVLGEPATTDLSAAHDRALGKECDLGVAHAHTRLHQLPHARGQELALLHLAELFRAAVGGDADLALVQLVVERFVRRATRAQAAHATLRAWQAAAAVGRAKPEADTERLYLRARQRHVRAPALELAREVGFADAQLQRLCLFDQELALDQALEHLGPQAFAADALRVHTAGHDQSERGCVLFGVGAIARITDRALLLQRTGLGLVARAELQNEHDDDGGYDPADQDLRDTAASEVSQHGRNRARGIPCSSDRIHAGGRAPTVPCSFGASGRRGGGGSRGSRASLDR